MVIETIDKTYDVIGFAKSDEAIKRYICKDISDNREYKLICVCTRELIEMLMPFFLTHEAEGKFRDYHGCFVDNGNLYLVFSYHEGQSIKDRLEKSSCTLEERIGLFGKLLEKLMLLAMPDGVAADVLKSDRILASDADEIEFSYELSNPASVVKNDKTDKILVIITFILKIQYEVTLLVVAELAETKDDFLVLWQMQPLSCLLL